VQCDPVSCLQQVQLGMQGVTSVVLQPPSPEPILQLPGSSMVMLWRMRTADTAVSAGGRAGGTWRVVSAVPSLCYGPVLLLPAG
jgi:hypothetical protein